MSELDISADQGEFYDPLKRKVGDPFIPEQPTDEVREFFGPAFSDVEEYVHMLEEEGEIRGLVGPREMPRLWSRHAVNAAAFSTSFPARGRFSTSVRARDFPVSSSRSAVLNWMSTLLNPCNVVASG